MIRTATAAGALALAWKQWPGMALNPQFDEGVQKASASGQALPTSRRTRRRIGWANGADLAM